MVPVVTDRLLAEYEALASTLGISPTDEEIVAALVSEHDWTPQGGTIIVRLARRHGVAVLRNALSLASALGIEDGASGL